MNSNKNKLILGDCLEIMKKMEDETIDLIYLDPPFFSNRNYEVIWGDEGEIRSFEDRWSGGIDQYINWLYDRVKEMHRLLKPTGSIYLHCDWHADAYIRVNILDKIFGINNFRNEIIWCYTGPANVLKAFPSKHDTIWRYSKSKLFTFNINEIRIPYKELHTDKGKSSAIWGNKGKLQDPTTRQKYIDKGKVPEDWWIDIPSGGHISPSERIGYPTQKPLALLERIIKASSNEGDIVLDPFMGGGTTMIIASRLNRKFIGIDQSIAALDVTDKRLQADGMFTSFEIEKHYYAEEDLKAMPHFEFEKWIVQKFGGKPNEKQVGDFGSDGEKDGVPIQVKKWKSKVGRVEVDKFKSACSRFRKFSENKEKGLPVGYFIAFDFAREAIGELARLKMEEGIIIEKKLVSDIVPIAKKPIVRVEWSKTEDGKYKFEAISESVILNYSWDFNYPIPAHKHNMTSNVNKEENQSSEVVQRFNPSVLYDKTGVRVHNFSSDGTHNIAVKVVDDKYLENIAVCTVTI